jgi:hypothetical protein
MEMRIAEVQKSLWVLTASLLAAAAAIAAGTEAPFANIGLCSGSSLHGRLYLSKDDGKTFQPFSQIPFGNIQRVCFDPDDSKHIYLTTFGYSVIKAPLEP